jgi:site-specific DNA-methyltransferase (adenine-specific)
MTSLSNDRGSLYHDNVLNVYGKWEPPICIVSDGPYGIDGFDGDDRNHTTLGETYRPHVEAWSKAATIQTTLWFWCTEVGWASVHPILEENGWIYRGCNIWDKGIKHIAGNCNGKTMRKFPVVTEVCAHYVRREEVTLSTGQVVSMQQWIRDEWSRSGLPFNKANEACGVKNAASRKYLAKDHMWYMPPAEEFVKLIDYANCHGYKEGAPYFSVDGILPLSPDQIVRLRAKFNFEYGVTNVWHHPPLRNSERLKNKKAMTHPNQKPLELMSRIITASTEDGDLVWEPFAGMATASVAAQLLNRRFLACEVNEDYYLHAVERLSYPPQR